MPIIIGLTLALVWCGLTIYVGLGCYAIYDTCKDDNVFTGLLGIACGLIGIGLYLIFTTLLLSLLLRT